MKHKKNKVKVLFLLLATLTIFPFKISAIEEENIAINANAAISVDYQSGAIYYGENIDEKISLASMSKFIVAWYLLEKIEQSGKNLEETTKISKRVSEFKYREPEASGAFLDYNMEITLRQLMELTIVISDGGAIEQLAEVVSGNEENLINEINEDILKRGYEKTKFINASGLERGEEYNYSTAREMVQITIELLEEDSEILEFTALQSTDLKGEELVATNLMLPGYLFEYEGIKGLKTGTETKAGASLMTYFEGDGKIIITLISGATNSQGEFYSHSRYTETIKMLDYSRKQVIEYLIPANQEIYLEIKNNGIDKDNFIIEKGIGVKEGIKTDLIFDSVIYNSRYITDEGILFEDVPSGEEVATLRIKVLDQSVGQTTLYYEKEYLELKITNKEETKEEGYVVKLLLAIPRFFSELYNEMI